MLDQSPLAAADPELAAIVERESRRQQETLNLIASENYVSAAVAAALASPLGHRYAEGYPGARYYGGQEHVDAVERLAICRARALFGAEHANVQPFSGAPANQAAYLALLQPGDTVLAMDLAQGGHLTHGHRLNFSGQLYRFTHYAVDPATGRLDYDALLAQARAVRPRLIVAGASSYPFVVDFAAFRRVADEVGALLMADIAHPAGLVAAGLYPSPVPYADVVSFTTHKTLRGPRGAILLSRAAHAARLDRAVFPGVQAGPHVNSIAAKAVCLHEAAQPAFREYAARVLATAQALAAALRHLGHTLVGGGTETHLMLLDLRPLGLGGARAQVALEEAGITANMNLIPYDPRPPRDPSGLRLGTPALATRGLGPAQMPAVAGWIDAVLRHPDDAALRARVRAEVRALCAEFPIPSLSAPRPASAVA